MVVVAIIGVLASIGLPQLNKYISKSRQSEARVILSGIYTAEKATFAEYALYSSRLDQIGFSPEGKLRYNSGFDADVNIPSPSVHPVSGTATNINTGVWCALTTAKCTNFAATPVAIPAGANLDNTAGSQAFIAYAIGAIGGTANSGNDEWTINEAKALVNSNTSL